MSQVERLSIGKMRDIADLSLQEQQRCFMSVFGTPADLLDNTARLFNLLAAMQDLRTYEAQDFDIWFFSQSNDDLPLESAPVFEEIAAAVLNSKASAAQIAALAQSWHLVPYWRVLESPGPWAGDPLAEFVCNLLHKLDCMQVSLNTASLLSADAEFSAAVRAARSSLPANFQPSIIVLVEGNTEAILLPKFLKVSGIRGGDPPPSFISCGGANQLLRKYLHLRDSVKLPILCVMDHDAESQIDTIDGVLRKQDRLFIWSVGEIEDTFSLPSLLAYLNGYLHLLGSTEMLVAEDISPARRRTELLDKLWRNRGLGDFDKVGFAEYQVSRLKQINDIPLEGRELMSLIKEMASGHGR